MATRSTTLLESNAQVDEETVAESLEVGQLFREAVRAAREENRRLGIPNVQVEQDGSLTEELPDGTKRPIRNE